MAWDWKRWSGGWTEIVPFRVDRGRLQAQVTYAEIDGRQEPVSLTIAVVGKRPLTVSDVRGLRFGQIVDKYRPRITWEVELVDAVPYSPLNKGRGGRPPKYGPDHWQKVAEVYLNAHATNRTPTRAVARRFHVSHSAAAKWVARCRALGLLASTSRGRARGGDEAWKEQER